jgi:flavin reductase (DIM6/NTAB) family NADH-FMN oxidoreductase RutF
VTLPVGVAPAQFRQLLGRFPTGVSVLTARGAPGGHPVGMTASSIASVSLEPPLVLVAVDHKNEMHAALRSGRHFAINVLSAEQEALARRFAETEANRFAGVGYRESRFGIPLLDGALAHIECAMHAAVEAGDHTIFIGLVTGGTVSERRPLLYYRGGYASL